MSTKTVNATAASLLGFLHDASMTGWDLVQTAQERIGEFWSLTPSQVYRELAWMAETGLIEAEEKGPRDRQPYRITKKGRLAFKAWVAKEPGPETIRFPLLLAVAFGEHIPKTQLAGILTRHRDEHAERLIRYEAALANLGAAGERDVYVASTLKFGVLYERAVLKWFEDLPRQIQG
jgi:DNA-binding PadR family transcriptional regulator